MKIDGRQIADLILQKLKTEISKIPPAQLKPRLIIFLIGNDPASLSFIRQKIKIGQRLGVEVVLNKYPISISYPKLFNDLKSFAQNPKVHGIIIQRPLPPKFDVNKLNQLIPPEKDIDGFLENSLHLPPVGLAVLEILKTIFASSDKRQEFLDWLKDKNIALLGFGQTAGRPIFKVLKGYGLNLKVVRSQTPDREVVLKAADIIISAVGKPAILKANEIKRGIMILGVGLNYVNGKATGDYEMKEIESVAKFYTPIPGGVGPVNVAYLFRNLISAYKKLNNPEVST